MRIRDWSSDVGSSDLLGVGDRDPDKRTVAPGAIGREAGAFRDLLAQVRRGVEQEPAPVVGADREGGLGAWPCGAVARAGAPAVGTVAVPLRETAARRGSQDADAHAPASVPSVQLRAGVAVDFEARSEEHTSELQSLMRIPYAVF